MCFTLIPSYILIISNCTHLAFSRNEIAWNRHGTLPEICDWFFLLCSSLSCSRYLSVSGGLVVAQQLQAWLPSYCATHCLKQILGVEATLGSCWCLCTMHPYCPSTENTQCIGFRKKKGVFFKIQIYVGCRLTSFISQQQKNWEFSLSSWDCYESVQPMTEWLAIQEHPGVLF